VTARLLLASTAILAASLASPPTSGAARLAVGIADGASRERVRAALEATADGPVESLAPLPVFVVTASSARELAAIPGVSYVEPVRVRRAASMPDDPLLPRQWYLTEDRAVEAWSAAPPLAGVRVAVIDSGVDRGHPELVRRIAAARSFVGGSARDTQGHGTIVAGIIAAETNNATGIAGLAPDAELLVAKVVGPERTISVEAEARAIRWAVAQGARVINMSIGGLRDPSNPNRDTYSRLEAEAVAYAVSKGVVVVAAVGNGDTAPRQPWPFASYPAALPHVLGVSAVLRSGAVPQYSNRDPVFNDVAAPAQDIVSTFPRHLTARRVGCLEQGYTLCAAGEFHAPEGTSFAAPQVSAAAAQLLAADPTLSADQVTTIIERAALDADWTNGCGRCAVGRDAYSGWGRLDMAQAAEALGSAPSPDRFETNDDAGRHAYRLYGGWRTRSVEASLDFWDDQSDVYGVYLRKNQRIDVSLAGPEGANPSLLLWHPHAERVDDLSGQGLRMRASTRPGAREHLGAVSRGAGWYFVHVKLGAPGEGGYRLTIARSRVAPRAGPS
jgi:subtilisin family serine protease